MPARYQTILLGALSGLLAAMAVDYQAFLAWKTFQDALTYNWRTALLRWGQGALAGAITAAGLAWI
jgi:hypothetical protein